MSTCMPDYLSTFYGITNTCPTLILLIFVMLLAEAIAATVVPNLTAMTVSESPAFTVYVLDVDPPPLVEDPELLPLSDGIATATGTIN